jgi:predicted transcriptional regulator
MMQDAKQAVRDLLNDLPDDCTLDDVLYHLYVLSNVERGRAEADAGKAIPHAQVAAELRERWVAGSRGQ